MSSSEQTARQPSTFADIGRHALGLGAFGVGLTMLVSGDFALFKQLAVLVCAVSAAQILGGIAIQFRRTLTAGVILIGAGYLVYTIYYVPQVFKAPQVYNSWGNVFEQLSLVTGAAIVYAQSSPSWATQNIVRLLRIAFGVSTASFGLEQAFYIQNTAVLVPTWLPPGQTFWAYATTAFFLLAALAFFTNLTAVLAARLLTMLIGFVVLVWPPVLLANPHNAMRWRETTETIAIAGAVWSLVVLLSRRNSTADA